MKSLDKLTMKEIIDAERISFDGERIDEDDLFDLARKNVKQLDQFSYKLEVDYDGEFHLSVY